MSAIKCRKALHVSHTQALKTLSSDLDLLSHDRDFPTVVNDLTETLKGERSESIGILVDHGLEVLKES